MSKVIPTGVGAVGYIVHVADNDAVIVVKGTLVRMEETTRFWKTDDGFEITNSGDGGFQESETEAVKAKINCLLWDSLQPDIELMKRWGNVKKVLCLIGFGAREGMFTAGGA